MKKKIIFLSIFLILISGLIAGNIFAQEQASVNIYFFHATGCPHCATEANFLAKLKAKLGDKINIYAFEITEHPGNATLYQEFAQAYGISSAGFSTPSTYIGERNIIGYYNDTYTGKEIENIINQCLQLGCEDIGAPLVFGGEKKQVGNEVLGDKVNLPGVGEIDVKNTSLFFTTLVIGALDGFNPCAMWVLIFLISLLLSVQSTARRWTLGIAFIIASGAVYFLFMAAWLNLFLFIGYLFVVRLIIGILAVGFGIYNLNKFIKNKTGTCEVTQSESRQNILEKIKNVALNKRIIPALFGIIILAGVVNLIELACSAGFPAIYTKILAANELSKVSYYLYLLLYIFIFMLDDIIVFIVAMVTLKLTGVDSKYAKYSNLIGGLIILILGILLVIKPEWLMFG